MIVSHHRWQHKSDGQTNIALWKTPHTTLPQSFLSLFLSQIWSILSFSLWSLIFSSVPELSCGQRAVLTPYHQLWVMSGRSDCKYPTETFGISLWTYTYLVLQALLIQCAVKPPLIQQYALNVHKRWTQHAHITVCVKIYLQFLTC